MWCHPEEKVEWNKHRGMNGGEASPPARLALIPARSFGGSLLGHDTQSPVRDVGLLNWKNSPYKLFVSLGSIYRHQLSLIKRLNVISRRSVLSWLESSGSSAISNLSVWIFHIVIPCHYELLCCDLNQIFVPIFSWCVENVTAECVSVAQPGIKAKQEAGKPCVWVASAVQ